MTRDRRSAHRSCCCATSGRHGEQTWGIRTATRRRSVRRVVPNRVGPRRPLNNFSRRCRGDAALQPRHRGLSATASQSRICAWRGPSVSLVGGHRIGSRIAIARQLPRSLGWGYGRRNRQIGRSRLTSLRYLDWSSSAGGEWMFHVKQTARESPGHRADTTGQSNIQLSRESATEHRTSWTKPSNWRARTSSLRPRPSSFPSVKDLGPSRVSAWTMQRRRPRRRDPVPMN